MEHKEPFRGARVIGWILLIIAVLTLPAALLYGAWDGIRHDFTFWQFAVSKIIVYLSFSMIKMVLLMIGAFLIAAGAVLWVQAVFRAKIDDGITNNRLVTDGVYALVRNPIYSAFLSVCTGTLMIYGNLWLLILPVLYWLFLTVLMKCTEEKWLKNLYGVEYEEYCRRVNRCIPWFPKNR